jgi:putative transposase
MVHSFSIYSVLYLDGLYVELRRDTVVKEVIYVVLGAYIGELCISTWEDRKASMDGGKSKSFNSYARKGVFAGPPGLEKAF